MKKGISTILAVELTISIMLGLAAVGWNFLDRQHSAEVANLKNQIHNLEHSVNKLEIDSAILSDTGSTSSTSTKTPASPDTTVVWKTYTNSTYKFSFRYPADWNITESAENFNDARKYLIKLNLDNGTTTADSISAEVLNMGDMVTLNFVNSYFGKIEGGPSELQDAMVNGQSVIKFYMEKATQLGRYGTGNIIFTNNPTAGVSTGVNFSTGSKSGSAAEVIADPMLNQIAGTFQFN